VLGPLGLLDEVPATCHPNFTEQLRCASRSDAPVVITDRVITSRAPGTAMAFALALVEALFGREKRDEIAAPMLVQ
jgi:4-methyl-5(b-hydroxyethyl)-thiazole monophosphate biosynthesis